MAEQHGVGDGAEERGAGERAQQRRPRGCRRRRARRRRGRRRRSTGANRSSDGRELRRPRRRRPFGAARSMPVIAATRCDRRSCSARLAATRRPCAMDDRHDQRERGSQRRRAADADLADRHDAERERRSDQRRGSHQQVDARSSQPYPMPTSRRRVVNQQNTSPPTAHCSSTVAASRRITPGRLTSRPQILRAVTQLGDDREKIFAVAKPFRYRIVSPPYN